MWQIPAWVAMKSSWSVTVGGGGSSAGGPASRPDPLPPLSGAYALTDAQRAQYGRDGHTTFRGLLSPEEAAAWRPYLVSAATRSSQVKNSGTTGKPFMRVHNLFSESPQARAFVFSSRIAQTLASLLLRPVAGSDADAETDSAKTAATLQLYQDSIFIKEPGDGESHWHQDQVAAPLRTPKPSARAGAAAAAAPGGFATIWIALSDMPAEAGPLCFASGSHAHGSELRSWLQQQQQKQAGEEERDGGKPKPEPQHGGAPREEEEEEEKDQPGTDTAGAGSGAGESGRGGGTPSRSYRGWTAAEVESMKRAGFGVTAPGPMRAGDATVHDGWLMHSAGKNASSVPREAIAISVFRGDLATVRTEVDAMDDYVTWCRWMRSAKGWRDGAAVPAELAPVLHSSALG
eukprot:g5288.t1